MGRAASLAFSALLSVGCVDVLGIEQLPGAAPLDGATDAPIDATPQPKAACLSCADNCAATRAACEGNVECAALWACGVRCPESDLLCRARCEAQHPTWNDNAAYVAFDRCLRRSCMQPCYGTGGILAAIDPRCACADVACQDYVSKCIQSDLDDTSTPPIAAGACERRLACIASAPNPDNFLLCDTLAGEDHALPLLDCARKKACADCPLATGVLACLPPPAGAGFRYGISRMGEELLILTVQDKNNAAVVGATARVCDPTRSCDSCQLAATTAPTGVADANGKIPLKVPMIGQRFDGCIRVEPPSGADLLPVLVSTGRPVVQTEDLLGTVMFNVGTISAESALAPAGIEADFSAHGHVIGTVHDCLWWHVIGAEISVSGGDVTTHVGYLSGSGVTQETSTNSTGAFAIFNLPPGRHTVTAKLDGKVIATDEIEVLTGQVTDSNLFPTPLP